MQNFLSNMRTDDCRGCIANVAPVADVYFFNDNTAPNPVDGFLGGQFLVQDKFGSKSIYNWFDFSRNSKLRTADGIYVNNPTVKKEVRIIGTEQGAPPCCDGVINFTVGITVDGDGCGLPELVKTYFTATDCTCPTLIATRISDIVAQMNADAELMSRIDTVYEDHGNIVIISSNFNFHVTVSSGTAQEINPLVKEGLSHEMIRQSLIGWNKNSPIIPLIDDTKVYRVFYLYLNEKYPVDNTMGNSPSYGTGQQRYMLGEKLIWLIFEDGVSDDTRKAYTQLLDGSSLEAKMLGVLRSSVDKPAYVGDFAYCSEAIDAGDSAALDFARAAWLVAYPTELVSVVRKSYSGGTSRYTVVLHGVSAVGSMPAGFSMVSGEC